MNSTVVLVKAYLLSLYQIILSTPRGLGGLSNPHQRTPASGPEGFPLCARLRGLNCNCQFVHGKLVPIAFPLGDKGSAQG